MKPAEIKKRARKLAKDGKIVDAIKALEDLAQSDVVDPYDLVTLGDLCLRADRTEDATTYYQRAVESYRDASLHRNGIALCKKVLRSRSSTPAFTLLLGELCEREGLVPDAVDAYLEYAEPLDPEAVKGKQPWLDSLSTLAPRNTGLLTRQAELLVRWSRGKQAIELLRGAAQAANSAEQRQQLLDIAEQIVQLGGDFDDDALLEEGASASGEHGGAGFDQGYLQDLAPHGDVETPSGAALHPDLDEGSEAASASASAEISAPDDHFASDANAAAERPEEPALPASEDAPVDGEGNHSHMMDLAELAAAMPQPDDEPENAEANVSVIDLSDVEASTAEQMSQILERSESLGSGSEDDAAPAEPLDAPELSDVSDVPEPDAPEPPEVEMAEGLESFAPSGAAARRGFEDHADDAEDMPELVSADGDDPSLSAEYALGSERQMLESRLMGDPYDVATLEKLVEVCTAQGDSHAVLDLRGRLAQAFLQVGRSEPALEQYRLIVETDPSREDMRQRYERLAGEIRGASNAASGGTAPGTVDDAGAESTFNVRGLSKVEVRDDAPASEDDMVDLGALLNEFRDELSSSMAGAPPRAHYDLGLSHMEMGLLEEAVDAFRSAAQEPEMEPEAREMWGRCLAKLDRHAEAIEVLRGALARRSDSLGIRYQLGVSLELAGQTDEARQLYESILRTDPNYEDTRERIASLGGSDCPAQPPERSS